jgi:hypothetical protein
MITQLIAIEIDLSDCSDPLNRRIEDTLRAWGEPLRWSITAIDPDTNIAQIEAIVTQKSEFFVKVGCLIP